MVGGGVLGLGWSGWAVIFHKLWGPQVSKTLSHVTNLSVNVSSPRCASIATPKPSFSAIRFPNALPSLYVNIVGLLHHTGTH
jgi:hypothetical protein